ncbi:glutamate--tRNA ligase [candidate division WOR-3 bacterium]|nr:glutamate--tRNA ligase [candidate division WOR-3 bacterium]
MEDVRVRFAPSPTGFPHVGNIRTALFNYLFARNRNGVFILRIEDTDRERLVNGSEKAIERALSLLEIRPDEGYGAGGDFGPYRQSERIGIYEKIAAEMIEKKTAYVCDCSEERLDKIRARLREEKKNPMYDRFCRDKNLPYEGVESLKAWGRVVRFASPFEGETSYEDFLRGKVRFGNETMDDMVLIKKDGFPTYNFANVVDDHFMKISHVLRGDEFISSTPKHVLLYRSLNWKEPLFVHLPVILGSDKKRLSKRHGSVSIEDYEKMGILPEAMFNFLSLLGWSPGNNEEILSREEIISKFSLEGLSTSPAVFDIKKLEWINSVYISKMTGEKIFSRAKVFLCEKKLVGEDTDVKYAAQVFELLKTRLPKLSDSVERAGYFFKDPWAYDDGAWKKSFSGVEEIEYYVESLKNAIAHDEPVTKDDFEALLRKTAENLGIKTSVLIHALRVSITGVSAGPGLFEICEVIGKERILKRLENALKKYKNEISQSQ